MAAPDDSRDRRRSAGIVDKPPTGLDPAAAPVLLRVLQTYPIEMMALGDLPVEDILVAPVTLVDGRNDDWGRQPIEIGYL